METFAPATDKRTPCHTYPVTSVIDIDKVDESVGSSVKQLVLPNSHSDVPRRSRRAADASRSVGLWTQVTAEKSCNASVSESICWRELHNGGEIYKLRPIRGIRR